MRKSERKVGCGDQKWGGVFCAAILIFVTVDSVFVINFSSLCVCRVCVLLVYFASAYAISYLVGGGRYLISVVFYLSAPSAKGINLFNGSNLSLFYFR